MTSKKNKGLVVSIVGPTAVGKTAIGIRLAKYFDTEIISADSRQLFREMELGTAKPSSEELSEIKHHFINSHSITESYNAGIFEEQATIRINQILTNRPIVFVVGGSTLYLKAIWEGFDEMPTVDVGVREELNAQFQADGLPPLLKELAEKDPIYFGQVDQQNGQRIIRALEVIRSSGEPFSSFRKKKKKESNFRQLKFGLNVDREILFDRINQRMDQMINAGLFEEARQLLPFQNQNALQTVGYSEIFRYLEGSYDQTEAIRLLKRNSRRYAKRQLTWLKKYEDINWYQPTDYDLIKNQIESTL